MSSNAVAKNTQRASKRTGIRAVLFNGRISLF
jgi:hypothetical protein